MRILPRLKLFAEASPPPQTTGASGAVRGGFEGQLDASASIAEASFMGAQNGWMPLWGADCTEKSLISNLKAFLDKRREFVKALMDWVSRTDGGPSPELPNSSQTPSPVKDYFDAMRERFSRAPIAPSQSFALPNMAY